MVTKNKYGIVHTKVPCLELTTMVGCPLLCTFCPQKQLKNAYNKLDDKYLSLNNLKIMLSNIPTITRIDFSGMSEPWANKECTAMLELVLSQGFNVALYTTLYGFKKDDVEKVKELLLDYDKNIETFCIHLPDVNNNMRGWRLTEDWLYAYRVLSSLKLSAGIKQMTMDKSSIIHPSITDIAKTTEKFSPIDRAGSLDKGEIMKIKNNRIPKTFKHERPITCKLTPFYDKNVVLPNGDVVLCCMDYSQKHVIGNLLKNKMEEILQGDLLANLISINESVGYSKESICKSCNRVTFLRERNGELVSMD